jgi:hypothetical protein
MIETAPISNIMTKDEAELYCMTLTHRDKYDWKVCSDGLADAVRALPWRHSDD